jgi:hypothetical protein
VFDGPIFSFPLEIEVGEKIKVEYPNPKGVRSKPFWFVEIVSK